MSTLPTLGESGGQVTDGFGDVYECLTHSGQHCCIGLHRAPLQLDAIVGEISSDPEQLRLIQIHGFTLQAVPS